MFYIIKCLCLGWNETYKLAEKNRKYLESIMNSSHIEEKSDFKNNDNSSLKILNNSHIQKTKSSTSNHKSKNDIAEENIETKGHILRNANKDVLIV